MWRDLSKTSQPLPNLHQRETEQVEPFPLGRVGGTWIFSAHANAPDAIEGTGFHNDLVSGLKKKGFEVGVLTEFGEVALDHDTPAGGFPDAVIETLDQPAQLLGLGRRSGVEDAAEGRVVLEQAGFFSHHEVLSRGIPMAFHHEGVTAPPLAKARSREYAISAGSMSPEE